MELAIDRFNLLGQPVEIVNDHCELFGLTFVHNQNAGQLVAKYKGLQVTMHLANHNGSYVFGTTVTLPGNELTGPYFLVNDEEDVTCELDSFLTMHLDAMVDRNYQGSKFRVLTKYR